MMKIKSGKILRGGAHVAGFLFLCSLVSYLHQNLPFKTIENNGQTRNILRSAHKNRNIASFYDEIIIEASDQLLLSQDKRFQQLGRNLKPNLTNLMFQKSSKRASLPDNPNDPIGDDVTLDDVYISVKTSQKYHLSRLRIVVDTWFEQAKDQTFFYTDADDPYFNKLTAGHMINTRCHDSHTRHDLTCKMSAEYDGFMTSSKKWWCHFDDDNYVNIDRLLALLKQHSWKEDVYLGRPSLGHPFYVSYKGKKEKIWFATGGAGVCISSALAQKMAPWCQNGEMMRTSNALRIPDDCTLGFVVSNRLSVNLTRSDLLHSHLERLRDIDFSTITEQVTLSYFLGERGDNNIITLPQSIPQLENDPTRIKSVHCHLFPTADVCR